MVGWRDCRHKRFLHCNALQRRFEIVDVAFELRLAFIGDRPGADHVGVGRGRTGLCIKLRKGAALARGFPLVARTGAGVDFVAAEPFIDVTDEARLAVFAVIDHVDAELGLSANNLTHGKA